MSHREAWVFFGDNGVSTAPFADNLPGIRQSPDQDVEWLAPDEPMLPALQVSIASLGIVAATVGALLAGI
jgi:hypothetical protein